MSKFRIKIRSRHPSHDPLRKLLPRQSVRSILRLGSTTEISESDDQIQINTVEAIRNSANKRLMKQCFEKGEVRTANWCIATSYNDVQKWASANKRFPLVSKHIFGSRGKGNSYIKGKTDLKAKFENKDLSNYIFEEFYSYNREYRLHVTSDGCFYTCRKLLKEDTPSDKRWFRNDSNSAWVLEENESFDKPSNWNDIVSECVKALHSCSLDIGACDVRVQSTKDSDGNVRKEPAFIVIEINSAPSFGEITLQRYLVEIPKIINSKIKKS